MGKYRPIVKNAVLVDLWGQSCEEEVLVWFFFKFTNARKVFPSHEAKPSDLEGKPTKVDKSRRTLK